MKCQSNRFESETGWAWKYGDGEGDEEESSWASFIRRRRVVLAAVMMDGRFGMRVSLMSRQRVCPLHEAKGSESVKYIGDREIAQGLLSRRMSEFEMSAFGEDEGR